MNLEKYKLEFNTTKTSFEFISEGPKGSILKRVEYSKIELKGYKNFYNLCFGDVNRESDKIDDAVVTNNGDRDKVLATVVSTLFIFTKRYPKAKILMIGRNAARKRLYRMAIDKHGDELSEIFDIQGIFNKKWLPFEKNIDFGAFLITLKMYEL
jgi:hypothetical protein